MQEQALQAHLFTQPLVGGCIAIFVVTGHRMANVLGMYANLVGTAGFDADFAITLPVTAFQGTKMAD